jgi:hypothetical protein
MAARFKGKGTMAQIVGAFASSHGPLLSTPPDKWYQRAEADRLNKEHWFRGKTYDFEGLVEARKPGFADQSTDAEKKKHYDACQRALDELAKRFRATKPDVVVIFGNDQEEVFHEDLTGAFTIYSGATIPNIPISDESKKKLPPGVEIALVGHTPPDGQIYQGAPAVASTIIDTMLDQGFAFSVSERTLDDGDRSAGIPHAFGFLYRRIMEDAPPPSVPIFTNVGVPPNRPRLGRILKFGHAMRKAFDALPKDLRVTVFASGGLTHFTIDEELDRKLLAAMASGDEKEMLSIPESYFEGNTCEVKSWYVLSALMNDYGKKMELIDYVPCYRSIAGTGNAMGFAQWQ